MSEPQISRRDLEALIVQRAWKDDAFRTEFLDDPKATIEKYSGQKIPDQFKVIALAEDDKTIHFVIPAKPATSDELSDEDLEKVAGGLDVTFALLIVPVVLAVVGMAGGGAAVGTQRNHGW